MRFIVALTLLIGLVSPAVAGDLMDARQARAAALAGEVVLIDIRTPREWARTGVPDVAHTLDMQSEDFVSGLRRLMSDNTGKPLAVICATGGRSTYVADVLGKNGVDVRNVREGMMGSDAGPGWLNRSLPVRRPDAARIDGQLMVRPI